MLLRRKASPFSARKPGRPRRTPGYAVNKARIGHLYTIAGREVIPGDGEPDVIFCVDESGPLNLQPRPGRQRALASGKGK